MAKHHLLCQIWQSRDKKAVRDQRRLETNLARYGVAVAHTTPEADAKRRETNRVRYGADNPFSREASTFDKVQDSMSGKRPILKGADNPFARPDVKAKIRDFWQDHHGVNGPQQVPIIRAATRKTRIEKYGGELRDSPILRERCDRTNLDRYGSVDPSGHPDIKQRIRKQT